MERYKFTGAQGTDFHSTLKSRVNQYFKSNHIRRDANAAMFVKSFCLLSWYLVPYFVLILAGITDPIILLLLWIMMGLGKAFIGTAVMHDALHGSYSKQKVINRLMGFSAVLVGVDELIWKIQHNVIHHTYTNVEEVDEDIAPRFFFRFSTHQTRRWFHRFQHIYALFFYCVPLIEWVTTKDFIKAFDYRKMKIIKPGKKFRTELTKITLRKLFYHAAFVVLPIFLIDVPTWMTIVMMLVSSSVTGIMLALIFQTAHVVSTTDFVKPEGKNIEQPWAVHQLHTTCNYGMNQKILTWLLGGLNFQIEHHLFPDVCHVHYPKIAKIVQQTTQEYHLPYHYEETFGDAVRSHFSMLKALGRPQCSERTREKISPLTG